MASVDVAAGARRDIKKIFRYLASRGGVSAADALLGSIVALRTRLESFPEAYAVRPSLGADIRVAVVASYLVLYRYALKDDRVVILRVLHGRRNITADFLKMP